MNANKLTREEMWAEQQICDSDVNYDLWERQKALIRQMSGLTRSLLFTVDVFKGRYNFASQYFADILGFKPFLLEKIENQGDLLEERIHPDDRDRLIEMQINHSKFIYSLPIENRSDYSQTFQFRMLNRKKEYINIVSSQHVLLKDKTGKAWIIMGTMNISPDRSLTDRIKCSVLNLKTGDILNPAVLLLPEIQLTNREKEILKLIRQGFLSKEIAHKLEISIYTVNNHRKSILSKLDIDNSIEAINKADSLGLLD